MAERARNSAQRSVLADELTTNLGLVHASRGQHFMEVVWQSKIHVPREMGKTPE
jgi:hypothetical protein